MRKYLWMAAVGLAACGDDTKNSSGNVLGETIVTPSADPSSGGDAAAAGGDAYPSAYLMGRYVILPNGGGTQLAWAGSRITTQISGTTSVSIGLHTSNRYNPTPIYFNVSIDGAAPTRFALDSSNPQTVLSYTTKLPDANPHLVQWTKITEASAGEAIFTGVAPGPGGSYRLPPKSTGRHIEFVGDSIVNGYGVLGSMLVGTSFCTGNANNSDADLSFATRTARALAADYTLIAYSGHGLATNLDGTTSTSHGPGDANNANDVVPAMFLDALPPASATDPNAAPWDANSITPDVVVINLGTNDFGFAMNQQPNCTATSCNPDAAAFTGAYAAFLRQVRATYPAAVIVPCVGPMLNNVPPPQGGAQHATALSYINAAISQVGDGHTFLYDFGVQDTTQPTGCDAHPSAAEHQLMATGGAGQQGLAGFIQSKMNWQ